MFLVAAAERTKHIRLGTGVNSLPYHNPFHIAERIVLLDHLSQGRAILGCGPGSLSSDAHMLGGDVAKARDRQADALEVILDLLDGKTVTRETDWYTLRDARLHLASYQRPRVEVAVASAASPSGPKLAGRHGTGLLNFAGTSTEAVEALRAHWGIVEAEAAKSGKQVSREGWRLTGIMHLADTEEQARADLRYGFEEFFNYQRQTSLLALPECGSLDELIDTAIEARLVTIGTPENAINTIQELADATGGFGSFLITLVDIAPYAAQRRSLELCAEAVIAHFRDQFAPRYASRAWTLEDFGGGRDQWEAAVVAATEAYAKETGVAANGNSAFSSAKT